GLSPHTVSRLSASEITHLFPVQSAVLPRLLRTRFSSAPVAPGDLCVSAPTGSGKTLAYALPIVETLAPRVIPRVRALVILPTRDLAAQVANSFRDLCKGSDLRVALVTGQTRFAREQAALVGRDAGEVLTEGYDSGSSRVDIVVATPGRLIDHVRGTRGFTLRHLRFLVIDEADRLLNQSFQDWLGQVLAAAAGEGPQDVKVADASLRRKDAPVEAADEGAVTTSAPTDSEPAILRHYVPLQKLLFSATLTRNPAKIASLHLHSPTYIAVASTECGDPDADPDADARYVAPATLSEFMIVVPSTGAKPLTLLHLLFTLRLKGVLIFCKSVESAHRLATLLQIFASLPAPPGDSSDSSTDSSDDDATRAKRALRRSSRTPPTVAAFSSDLPASDRTRLLASLRNGTLTALVCSDLVARGMDLGSGISAVINYDAPTRAKTYVHRIGRTARAGREGVAYSLLEDREVRWFKKEVRKIERVDGARVRNMKVAETEVEGFVGRYRAALEKLGE
ncbi:P-loop containing nucleoside triphosphate hydrolase protein, partial [Blyttiomyces helicus]